MKKVLGTFLVIVTLSGGVLTAQTVSIQENYFNEFITFYVSSVDVSTGATDVQLFEMEVYADQYPVPIEIEFTIRINSIPLDLDYEDEFLTVLTEPFNLEGPIRVRNTELDMNTTQLNYSGPPFGVVPVSIPDDNISFIDLEELEEMQSLIMQSGRLPDGTYRFAVVIRDPDSQNVLASWDRVIISAHPVTLELITPGGVIEDTSNTAITTTYPFFQWESDPCPICTYQIRVAEYIPGEHSSVDDAIEDQTVLPLNQAMGFHEVGHQTSLQYPQSGAIDLEEGHTYVWQVQKTIPTTEGDETVSSFIWAFQIIDPTAAGAAGTAGVLVAQGPILRLLRNVMGPSTFERAFDSGGRLEGFRPNRVVRLNGESIDPNRLAEITNALQQGTMKIISWEVQ